MNNPKENRKFYKPVSDYFAKIIGVKISNVFASNLKLTQ